MFRALQQASTLMLVAMAASFALTLPTAAGPLPRAPEKAMAAIKASTAVAPTQSYSIDQARYFATPEVERAELKQRIEEASAFPAVAPEDPKALYDYLHRADVFHAQFLRHAAYLHLRVSQDIDDQADADASEQVDDADGQVLSNAAVALHAFGSDAFSKAASVNPALNRYAYLPALAERALAHGLPADQQRILDALAGPAASNLWTLYQKTLRSTPFAKVATTDGELDAIKDGALLSLNPDRAVRQAAWQARWDGYVSRADIYATILLGVVRLNDRTAKLERFPDAPSQVYLSRNLDRTRVTEALGAIESHAELFKAYQRLRASHVAASTGIADVHSWDLLLPTPGFTVPYRTLDQSRAAVLSALAPLGADYVEHFRQLLDPANGRMDIAAAQGKRTNGGFSIGAPGVPSGLFVESYGPGLINDTRVIIHEGGHAIHRQLMAEADIPSFYAEGPYWMFEAFAILNEFLLYDHLYQASTDLKARAYYLEWLLGDMTFTLFGSAEEAMLEQSIYDGVVAGQIRDTADLDALTLLIWSKYEIWPASEPQLAHTWISKRLMFQDPLYQVNYLYAGLLATKMFDMIKHDPAAFQKGYLDLLRNGFYAPPEQLLRKFLGRELSQRELVDDSMDILQQRIQSLAGLYKKFDTKH
jgi:oligoendopeptidase F